MFEVFLTYTLDPQRTGKHYMATKHDGDEKDTTHQRHQNVSPTTTWRVTTASQYQNQWSIIYPILVYIPSLRCQVRNSSTSYTFSLSSVTHMHSGHVSQCGKDPVRLQPGRCVTHWNSWRIFKSLHALPEKWKLRVTDVMGDDSIYEWTGKQSFVHFQLGSHTPLEVP